MEKAPEIVVDRKLFLALVLVCMVLGGSFAFIYLDLKADFAALKNNYANLSAQIEQLRSTIETLHSNQAANLTAVQIYNQTKFSVVLITNKRNDGSVVEGSGFVYDMQGHIVTNNHVVEGEAEIRVTFSDGTVTSAQLIGGDVYSDLAVIKVEAEALPEQAHGLALGNSSLLMVGEPVYAIGNPLGLSGSMTAGIVSQVGRVLRLGDLGVPPPRGNYSIVDVIQFDAAVNPGNSGGPLLNSWGLVVGVTFAIETAEEVRGFIGIGYAVPSDVVSRAIPSIISTGGYAHPWVGVEVTDMTPEIAEEMHTNYTRGIRVVSVMSGSPAEKAGLQKNDIIIGADGRTISQVDELLIYLERYKRPGDTIILKIVRNNEVLDKSLTLEKRPT
ncbi:trypsin-like peptidase domain-containing protein [Candidatus Bathyarchaeota archaeon]|nr:trypsin-like peptidase domain-containing protein [Candidatus Bathyarchaeota archaeon]